MVAVRDLAKGKEFYGGTLGLQQVDENPGGVAYRCGTGQMFVYQSDTAGSGKATAACWLVPDVAAAVDELKEKGITFEHYDFPGMELHGDVHSMMDGAAQAAWFKDPDGNILSINNAPATS
jgi:catechol 2,3-dioxygenase-like lactoylglutathione lyase family enzyme